MIVPGISRRKAVLNAFEHLVQAESTLSPAMKEQVIASAREYAERFNLAFDGTFKGALKLAEEADQVVQDEVSKQERINRQHVLESRQRIIDAGYHQHQPFRMGAKKRRN